MTHRNLLIKIRHEFANDWLTLDAFASHHHLTPTQAEKLLDLVRDVESSKNPHS